MKNLAHFELVRHYSAPIKVRISGFEPKIHLSTLRMLFNLELDWHWSFISFLISKPIPSWPFCIYLVRSSPAFFSTTTTSFQVITSMWGDLKDCGGREQQFKEQTLEQSFAINCFTIRPFHGATILGVPMMTSSNGNIFRVTGRLCGEFTCHRWIPTQRSVTQSFGVFFDLRLNKRLSKQSWDWWFQTPSSSLWRHLNDWRNTFLGRGLRWDWGSNVAI